MLGRKMSDWLATQIDLWFVYEYTFWLEENKSVFRRFMEDLVLIKFDENDGDLIQEFPE